MNYSEEEKEAIERIQKRIKDNEDYSTNQVWLTEDVRCARTVLNLIQKQEEEIKELKEDISNMYDEKVVRNILEDECGLSKFEIDEILNLEVEEENENR